MGATGFDVIVVGAGVMGSATAWALAKRGQRVLCLDQFAIPNTMGSSHGQTRITRMAYFEHPNYVPLLRRANELWHELEELSGRQLLLKTGGLYVGPPDCPLITGSKESAELHQLPYELLTRDEVGGRYPQFRLPEDYVGFFEADGGVLFPEACVTALFRAAVDNKAEFHGHEKVLEWMATDKAVRVRTHAGTYEAGRLVFCAGPWASQVLSGLRVELKVTRQVAGWFWPQTPEAFLSDRFPICAMQDASGSFSYAFPMFPDRPGLKAASHDLGPTVSPDGTRPEPHPDEAEAFLPALRTFLPEAVGPLLTLNACLYTNSPDGHFILDRHPQQPNVTFGCGFSGHGFKFGSVVGEVLADLSLEGRSRHPVEFLGLTRFR